MHEQQLPTRTVTERPETGVYTRDAALPEGPHIYVVDEGQQARGYEVGVWLAADQTRDQLVASIARLIRRPLGQDELAGWAIHGYTGFGSWQLKAHEEIDTISRLAREIQHHGEAFSSWAWLVRDQPELRGQFKQHYLGTWNTPGDFIREFAEDIGLTPDNLGIGERWKRFVRIDYQALLTEVLRPGDLTIARHEAGISVFLKPPLDEQTHDPASQEEPVGSSASAAQRVAERIGGSHV